VVGTAVVNKRVVGLLVWSLVLLDCTSVAARLPLSIVDIQAKEAPAGLQECAMSHPLPSPPALEESDHVYANDLAGCGIGSPSPTTRFFDSTLVRYPDEKEARAAYEVNVQGGPPSKVGTSTGFGPNSEEITNSAFGTVYMLDWQRGPYVYRYLAIGLTVGEDRHVANAVYQRTPDK
jgi:hypothetical protein